MGEIARFLKTQELYEDVLAAIPAYRAGRMSETDMRALLDRVLSAGKIAGRLTVFDDKDRAYEEDRLIEHWRGIIDAPHYRVPRP